MARTPEQLQEAVDRFNDIRRIEDDRGELRELVLADSKFAVVVNISTLPEFEKRLYAVGLLADDARRRIVRVIDAELRQRAESLRDYLAKADVDLAAIKIGSPLK